RAGRRRERPAPVPRLPDRPAREARHVRRGRGPALDGRVAPWSGAPSGRALGRGDHRASTAPAGRRSDGRAPDRRVGLGRRAEALVAADTRTGALADELLAVGAGGVRAPAAGTRAGG